MGELWALAVRLERRDDILLQRDCPKIKSGEGQKSHSETQLLEFAQDFDSCV